MEAQPADLVTADGRRLVAVWPRYDEQGKWMLYHLLCVWTGRYVRMN